MRDAHLWIEILLWENIARTLDLYVADNSETSGSKEIVGILVSISTGQLHQNATERKLRNLFIEVRKKKWFSLLEEPFKFPTDGFPVLEYGDIVDEEDGMIYPLLRGEVDGRHMLAGADIIIGRATTSADQFCIYGCDLFMTEEYLKDFGLCL